MSYVFVSGRREEIGKLSAFRTSFGGQVLCNPSFCGTQIAINNHGNRLVVNSLVTASPFYGSYVNFLACN